MFSRRKKCFQTSLFFLRAVNYPAGDVSVAAPGILIPTELWLPSGVGADGWEMLREPGLSTLILA